MGWSFFFFSHRKDSVRSQCTPRGRRSSSARIAPRFPEYKVIPQTRGQRTTSESERRRRSFHLYGGAAAHLGSWLLSPESDEIFGEYRLVCAPELQGPMICLSVVASPPLARTSARKGNRGPHSSRLCGEQTLPVAVRDYVFVKSSSYRSACATEVHTKHSED